MVQGYNLDIFLLKLDLIMATFIITGVGGNVSLGGLKFFNKHRVIGCDTRDEFNAGRYFVDRFIKSPPSCLSIKLNANNLNVEINEKYIKFIKNIVKEENVDLVLANPDPDVYALSTCSEIPLVTSSPSSILLSFDKYKTGKVLKKADVPTPSVWLRDEFPFEIFKTGKFLIKHRWGHGGIGNRQLSEATFNNLTERDIITEQIDGNEFAVFLTFNKGKLAVEGAFQKRLYFAGEGRWNITVDRPDLIKIACQAIHAICRLPHGTYHVDIMNNMVLEINTGRSFGGTPDPYLCWASNINLPEVLLAIANKEPLERKRILTNIKMTNFNNYLFEYKNELSLFRGEL